MLRPAKLNLSNPRPTRDVWRAMSDLSGGTLALVAWLSLWLWIVVEVVHPLSGTLDVERVAALSLF